MGDVVNMAAMKKVFAEREARDMINRYIDSIVDDDDERKAIKSHIDKYDDDFDEDEDEDEDE